LRIKPASANRPAFPLGSVGLEASRGFQPKNLMGIAMSKLLSFLLLTAMLGTAGAADWDARTTRTNTTVTDPDIQMALSQGITPAFVTTFPIKQYGIHALVDRHVVPEPGPEIIYVSLGLCRRLPDGRYELAHARYSDVILLQPRTPAEAQREAVSQKLAAMATAFSGGMVQSAATVR
jgi:hypothetical protein